MKKIIIDLDGTLTVDTEENYVQKPVNEIVNSQGRFRAKSINLLQLKASEINYWKVGAFITAVKEPDISYD